MKSFAVAAALVSVVAAHSGLLDDVFGSESLENNIKLPAGIEINQSIGPKYPPPSGRTNVWHPSHPHVDMDGCDATDDDWHYVHPCESCEHGHHTWTTSTATSVVTKTVIDCAPTVTDCPARTTAITTVTTTICPATNTAATPTAATPTAATPTAATPTTATVTLPTVPVRYSSTPEVVTESPCPETTPVAPPPVTQTPVWTTAPAPPPTRVPVPPSSVKPPVAGNNTWTQPPVIVNGGAQAQIGLFAAVAAVAALL